RRDAELRRRPGPAAVRRGQGLGRRVVVREGAAPREKAAATQEQAEVTLRESGFGARDLFREATLGRHRRCCYAVVARTGTAPLESLLEEFSPCSPSLAGLALMRLWRRSARGAWGRCIALGIPAWSARSPLRFCPKRSPMTRTGWPA